MHREIARRYRWAYQQRRPDPLEIDKNTGSAPVSLKL